MQRQIEETFNRALADALRSVNQNWEEQECYVETSSLIEGNQTLRPDILICENDAPPVVIECSYDPNDADQDAAGRIGLRLAGDGREISTAIAIAIPVEFQQMTQMRAARKLRDGSGIGMALYRSDTNGHERFPTTGHIKVSLNDLSDMTAVAAATGERVVQLANEVSKRIQQAANILNRVPDYPRQQMAETMQHNVLNGLQVVCLMWMNALLVQNQLHREGRHDVGPVIFDPARQPVSTEYLVQWRQILDINWLAIFQPAVSALEIAVNYEYVMHEVMERLIRAVQGIETARLGRYINIGAELFPILSDDRKEAAAFYTNASTAEFLARLTIRRQDLNESGWAQYGIYQNHQLADFACGTGTLLRAGHNRIMALARQAGMEPDGNLYRQAMEQGLIGVDVSPIVAHLTASSLAMLGGNEPYGHTNIGWIGVGQPIGRPGRATTGSLEYLAQDSIENFLDEGGGYGQAAGQAGKPNVIEIENDSIDWVLMNPPYSRTRGGQSAFDIADLTKQQRRQCQERWGDLIRNLPAIKTAGMGASYLVLARQKVRPGGRIGFVLPLTAAFAESWAQTRVMIECEFTDIIAITIAGGSQEGELSADTGMNEMMLVATRKTENMGAETSPVNCVTLNIAPTHNGIAGELARASETTVNDLDGENTIASAPIMVGGTRTGAVMRLPDTGHGVPWFPLGAVSISYCLFAWYLVQGRYLHQDMTTTRLNVPMTTIGNLFDVGPTHHLIGHTRDGKYQCGTFVVDLIPENRPYGLDRMLWANDAQAQTCLMVDPTHSGTPRRGVNPDDIRHTASTLFYNRNLRWTSQKLVAASTKRPVMGGSSWVSLRHTDERVHKATSLWFNSLFGMIVQWARGQRTQQGRARNQIKAVKGIPVPRLDNLADEVLNEAVEFFDGLREEPLLRLRQASEDNVRGQIDTYVCRMMGLNITQDELADWQDLFCREPTVRG